MASGSPPRAEEGLARAKERGRLWVGGGTASEAQAVVPTDSPGAAVKIGSATACTDDLLGPCTACAHMLLDPLQPFRTLVPFSQLCRSIPTRWRRRWAA